MKRIRTIDAHAAGEPLRVVVDGFPEIPGETMLERRAWARANLEPLRRALMWEPRGHVDMYGCLLTPPASPDGHKGVLFMHNQGYSTMCGHGVIALVTIGLDHGLLPEPDGGVLRLDTPAGRVEARARREGGRVRQVTFRNVPSFVLQSELSVEVAGLGRVRCDVAFGGAFYAYAEAEPLGLELVPGERPRLVEAGMAIKRAVAGACPILHPDGDADLSFLYGTILVRGRRHACVFADGQLDRSPTGTGVSGRAAILHARGELEVGEGVAIESVLDTRFEVRVVETTSVGPFPAVVPEVTGAAHVTGRHEFLIDPEDPLREGFLP